jgi:hypothetical protein
MTATEGIPSSYHVVHLCHTISSAFLSSRILSACDFKRDEVTEEWRKLHNEELNALYSLPNIVWVVKLRRMRWAGHVAHMGEDRGVHRVLVGKREGKWPLGRPRRRWEDNIKRDLQEVGGGSWGLDGVGSG